MSEIINIAEQTEELGKRDKLESIDTTLPLAEISAEDRKTAFDAKAEELLNTLKEVSSSEELSDEEKKAKAGNISIAVAAMKDEFLNIGMTSLKERKEFNIAMLKQLNSVYTALLKFFTIYTATPEAEELKAIAEDIIAKNKYTEYKTGEPKVFLENVSTYEEIVAIKDNEAIKNVCQFMSSKVTDLAVSINNFLTATIDVTEILNLITPRSIIEKIKVVNDISLFNSKRKSFATFCKKKIGNPNFHKNLKTDEEYFGLLFSLFSKDAEDAITEEYVSDIFDLDETTGINTKAEYISRLKADNTLTKIASISALYMIDLVQKSFADNTKSQADRTSYINSLYAKSAYTDFRKTVIRAVYMTPYSPAMEEIINIK